MNLTSNVHVYLYSAKAAHILHKHACGAEQKWGGGGDRNRDTESAQASENKRQTDGSSTSAYTKALNALDFPDAIRKIIPDYWGSVSKRPVAFFVHGVFVKTRQHNKVPAE